MRWWQLDDSLEPVGISQRPILNRAPTSSASRYQNVNYEHLRECKVSLGDTVLDGFAVLGVDHGLIFVG